MNHMYALPEPEFNSDLVALIFEIERLRSEVGLGTTPFEIYLELHQLFDTVMSVVSARIEGNHTTVYEALENVSHESPLSLSDHLAEIANIAETARYIDSLDPLEPLTHAFVRDLHERAVRDLKREGDPTPGKYREREVGITGSAHTPPSWVTIHAEMSALLQFANAELPLRQQMMQVAVAHHRFVWLHPFNNGNGRVSRLFTYAMLRKTIFSARGFSALNPTSVFGNDRAEYIAALEGADSLSNEGTARWTTFFARGIRDDLDRVVKLQDHRYVMSELVGPVLAKLVEDGVMSSSTEAALRVVLQLGVVKAGDLAQAIPGTSAQRSRSIRDLVDRKLLRPTADGARFYLLSLSRGPIAIRLIRRLDELGFLPRMLSGD